MIRYDEGYNHQSTYYHENVQANYIVKMDLKKTVRKVKALIAKDTKKRLRRGMKWNGNRVKELSAGYVKQKKAKKGTSAKPNFKYSGQFLRSLKAHAYKGKGLAKGDYRIMFYPRGYRVAVNGRRKTNFLIGIGLANMGRDPLGPGTPVELIREINKLMAGIKVVHPNPRPNKPRYK